jgi:hypothetical protein
LDGERAGEAEERWRPSTCAAAPDNTATPSPTAASHVPNPGGSPHFTDDAAAGELAEEVGEECEKLGEVSRITVFSAHPEGVVMVRFKSAGAAAEALSVFNGRYFGGQLVTCEFWDGATDYGKALSHDAREAAEAEEQRRIESFGAWLEQGSDEEQAEEGGGK